MEADIAIRQASCGRDAQGDVLVVWRLDRLGRSMPYLASVVHALGE